MESNYDRGRRFEYKVRDHYKAQGCLVGRSAGSKGCFDLIAISPRGTVILIQCKKRRYISPLEKLDLSKTAKKFGVIAHYVTKGKKRGTLEIEEI